MLIVGRIINGLSVGVSNFVLHDVDSELTLPRFAPLKFQSIFLSLLLQASVEDSSAPVNIPFLCFASSSWQRCISLPLSSRLFLLESTAILIHHRTMGHNMGNHDNVLY
jgi:hypothetical protein